jgi:DNA-binding winged helix-turn-helix (wHTH) protein
MNAVVRFGDWTLDHDSRELRGPRGGVHLSPKAFDLLEALMESRPRVLSKSELRDRLWANTFVSESSLSGLVKEIRKALGDPVRRPAFVRTVHRHGYAFCGTVFEAAAPAGTHAQRTCRLVCGPHEFLLALGENVLGRVETAAAWIDSATVSRRHARIVVSSEGATLEDLGSKNGTYLGGRRLESPAALADGDEIRLGSVSLTFRLSPGTGPTETDAGPRAGP